MQISLTQAGKRFNKEWIFKNLDVQFEAGKHYALVGNNGSGKSTLLQIIAGYSSLTKGSIEWSPLDADSIYKEISFAAPYMELVEEFTATEIFEFQAQFKSMQTKMSFEKMLALTGLQNAAKKQIRYYSSGMKQRLKLALAIFSDAPILLLDEPCSNLDQEGMAMYQSLINEFAMHKLIIVASNDPAEYQFCKEKINLMDYKMH